MKEEPNNAAGVPIQPCRGRRTTLVRDRPERRRHGARRTARTPAARARSAVAAQHGFEMAGREAVRERGARPDPGLLDPEARGGPESPPHGSVPARRWGRADLSARLDRPAGTFSAAHYHPTFTGNEPC